MEYFLLRQDRSGFNPIKPLGIDKYKKVSDFEDFTTVQIARQSLQQYLDLLESPRTMISDKIKNILFEYNSMAIFKSVVLTDKQSMVSSIYWLFEMPEIDCIADSCDFHKKFKFESLVIEYKKVKDYAFFVIMGVFEPYLLVNLEVAEKILRADPWGLKFERIKTI